ncbi:MAG TPA: hypothetical protein VGK35_00595 [Actinotalea sp.]|jgi:hypothetical protein
MRWDALFADMELQLAAADADARAQEVADVTRAERAAVLLADRLRAAVGRPLAITVVGGRRLEGTVVDAAAAWVLVGTGVTEHLVPITAVATVSGLPPGSAAPAGAVLRRLGLGHALRAIARDRSLVRVTASGAVVRGRIDAVGADHLDVGLAFEDDGRPTGERQAVAFARLEVVSTL